MPTTSPWRAVGGGRCRTSRRPRPAGRGCGGIAAGKIVDFCHAVSQGHGFRLANGVFTAIDGPGASLTVPDRSNNRGQVVGAYIVPDGTPVGRTHGFLLDKES
jgi:hypothetical protein